MILFPPALCLCVLVVQSPDPLRPLFNAIRQVESSGISHPADGDGGRSIGPYQISRAYWKDARIAGRYQNCRDRDYAERVMLAYWKRYCPQALKRNDFQTLSRVHNGGPTGHRKPVTRAYWRGVDAALHRLNDGKRESTTKAQRHKGGL